MTKQTSKPDTFFQIFIKTFGDAFGFQEVDEMEAQKREIIPEFVIIDSVAIFPDDFDYTKLSDRIFPFLGQKNVIEYKGKDDELLLSHLCQYSQIELGIITNHFLTKVRKKRKERVSLSQKEAAAQWEQLQRRGAQHSCCTIILSTRDPIGLRESFQFEAVDTYEHLTGALYRHITFDNKLTGSVVTYIVVLNQLPICPENAPLLLLSTGSKQKEYCNWLLDTHEDLTLQEQEEFLFYLVKYNLVQDKEIQYKMRYKINWSLDDISFLLDMMEERQPEIRMEFYEKFSESLRLTHSPVEVAQTALQASTPLEVAQTALQASTPLEVAQTALQASTPLEVAQRALKADTPLEMAQTALQAKTPEEAALQFIHSEEQVERLIELMRQRNHEKAEPAESQEAIEKMAPEIE